MRCNHLSQSAFLIMIIVVGVLSLATPATSRPRGAPTSACTSLTPGHGRQPSIPAPYTIDLMGVTTYQGGDFITVIVRGNVFAGILMQVREVGTTTIHGRWTAFHLNTRSLTCTNTDDSVTHANTNSKQNAVFTWQAPQGVTVDLEVIATVASGFVTWWREVKSSTLTFRFSTSSIIVPSASPSDAMSTSTIEQRSTTKISNITERTTTEEPRSRPTPPTVIIIVPVIVLFLFISIVVKLSRE